MLHEPAAQSQKDPAFPYKKRIGVRLFLVYGLVYACFIAINVMNPKTMEAEVFSGLNLAVVYGFGLIVVALLMALVYNAICGKREKAMEKGGEA